MPVDFFSVEALKFYLIVLAIASPFIMLVGMIIYAIRQHDKSWQRRGFDVKLIESGKSIVRQQEHD
jgi:hypothetical protein